MGQPERGVKLTVQPGINHTGDLGLLRTLLQNLIGNAWKYTGKASNARIEFGMVHRDGEKVFFVRDNGIGFDMRYANKLFQPFQRLHAATEFQGTGIGLAIVQRIVNRHGVKVWAEAEVSKGAAFYFTLG